MSAISFWSTRTMSTIASMVAPANYWKMISIWKVWLIHMYSCTSDLCYYVCRIVSCLYNLLKIVLLLLLVFIHAFTKINVTTKIHLGHVVILQINKATPIQQAADFTYTPHIMADIFIGYISSWAGINMDSENNGYMSIPIVHLTI